MHRSVRGLMNVLRIYYSVFSDLSFFFSSRRPHTRFLPVLWAWRFVLEAVLMLPGIDMFRVFMQRALKNKNLLTFVKFNLHIWSLIHI